MDHAVLNLLLKPYLISTPLTAMAEHHDAGKRDCGFSLQYLKGSGLPCVDLPTEMADEGHVKITVWVFGITKLLSSDGRLDLLVA